MLLSNIVTACKEISHLVNRGNLVGVLGSAESENVQGEEQKNWTLLPMILWLMRLTGRDI